jgi:hypothetical protein
MASGDVRSWPMPDMAVLLPCPLAGAKRTIDRRRHQQFESRSIIEDNKTVKAFC